MRIASRLAATVFSTVTLFAFDEPEGLLDRFRAHIQRELEQMPNFVCSQEVDRFTRPSPDGAWRKVDALRFEVAAIGDKELYAKTGAAGFDGRPLAELVGRGTIGTGQFANLAKHVFVASTAAFTYAGETEESGRAAYEYRYDVPANRSSYSLHSGAARAVVAFQGAFWIDRSTLDLIRLDVQAYDLPPQLGIAQADTSIQYARAAIGERLALLPVKAMLSVVASDGVEDLNRARLSGCREYRVDSEVRFDTERAGLTGSAGRSREFPSIEARLPEGAMLEIALDSEIDLQNARAGDPVRATLTRAIRSGSGVMAAEGAAVFGRVVRLEQESMPFPMHEIGLEFDAIEMDGRTAKFAATMIEAGPAPGLIRQKKTIDPTFTRRRAARLEILVREVQRGQGILHWDDRKGPLPRGLKMKWRIEAPRE
jgi:hypothetical protein